MHSPIQRQNLSDDAADRVRNLIVDGTLPPGERINEVHLSRQLGVSRTPLREALALLAREGALDSVPRVGWFVRPLTLEEFEQVYAIRPMLDPEALRLAGLPSPSQLHELERLNARIGAASEPQDVISLDDEWHLLLIEACPNRVLIDLIQEFMGRTRRYEMALMRERELQATAVDHAAIMAALRRRDLESAVAALRANLIGGHEPIRLWLQQREQGEAR